MILVEDFAIIRLPEPFPRPGRSLFFDSRKALKRLKALAADLRIHPHHTLSLGVWPDHVRADFKFVTLDARSDAPETSIAPIHSSNYMDGRVFEMSEDSQFLEWLHHQWLKFWTHEAQEWFQIKGVPFRDPHKDLK